MDEHQKFILNVPFVSAIMQSVSDSNMAIALARNGGLSFIYGSQPIDDQVEMVRKVKKFKAGFVVSNANLTPENSLKDVIELKKRTGFSTIAVTDDGTSSGKLLGMVTSRDYRPCKDSIDKKVKDFMTPFSKLVKGKHGISLDEANDIIWDHKINTLPIVDENQRMRYFVFRKDYENHMNNPYELLDSHKRLLVGAGVNSRDFRERIPKLVDAEVDVMCIDSSDGFSEWQKETIEFVRENYGDKVKIGAGNVVDKDGFNYLAEAGADFIKVGIGGGSICITGNKSIGRGRQLLIAVRKRDEYFQKNRTYNSYLSEGVCTGYHRYCCNGS